MLYSILYAFAAQVVLTNNAVESKQRVEESIRRFFQTAPLRIIGRAFKLPAGSDPILDIHVESVIASSEEECAMSLPLLSWDAEYRVSVIRLSDEVSSSARYKPSP